MRLKMFAGLCWAVLLCLNSVGLAQEAGLEQEIRVLKGQVAQIRWVTSTLVARWLDGSRFDEMTLIVEKGAKIYKNGKTVTLSSLNHGDQVTVEYYDDVFEGLKAVKISVVGGL